MFLYFFWSIPTWNEVLQKLFFPGFCSFWGVFNQLPIELIWSLLPTSEYDTTLQTNAFTAGDECVLCWRRICWKCVFEFQPHTHTHTASHQWLSKKTYFKTIATHRYSHVDKTANHTYSPVKMSCIMLRISKRSLSAHHVDIGKMKDKLSFTHTQLANFQTETYNETVLCSEGSFKAVVRQS